VKTGASFAIQPPSLVRAATDSTIPGIKRELSDVSLLDIPAARAKVHQTHHLARREVDLTAVTQATEIKLQRKLMVERETQEAIAILKKPNRGLALQEVAETVDKKVTSKSRKSAHPVRNLAGGEVVIEATPKGNRRGKPHASFNNVSGYRLPAISLTESTGRQEPEIIPSTSDPYIPSSSVRPSYDCMTSRKNISSTPRKSVQQDHRQSMVDQTPSRRASGLAKTTSLMEMVREEDGEEDDLCQSSPELPKLLKQPVFKRPTLPTALPETPVKRQKQMVFTPVRQMGEVSPSEKRQQAVPDTQIQITEEEKMVDELPESEDAAETSIYQALGWDDDFDDLM